MYFRKHTVWWNSLFFISANDEDMIPLVILWRPYCILHDNDVEFHQKRLHLKSDIESALVLSPFYFSMFNCYFSLGFIPSTCIFNTTFHSQDVCYIFVRLFFRIYLGFSGSLSVNRCWVNDVHVGGLWCAISPNRFYPIDFKPWHYES